MSALTQRAHLAPATPVAGILMAMIAFAMFTGMDTAIKLLAGRYHVLQVMWLNSLFALLAVVVIGRPARRLACSGRGTGACSSSAGASPTSPPSPSSGAIRAWRWPTPTPSCSRHPC